MNPAVALLCLAVVVGSLFMLIYAPQFNSTLLGIDLRSVSNNLLDLFRTFWVVIVFAGIVGMMQALRM